MDRKRATLIGLAAILLWSTMVGLIRSMSEGLGPVGGAAMIYTLSGLLCLVTVGFPDIRRFSPRYLIAGSVLFVSYEICLALSLGYAATRSQAIEVGMVNYLWPSLTIVFAILFNGQKSTLWVIPGLLISLLGVCWVLGGEEGLHLEEITRNVVSSPLSYALAFAGAFANKAQNFEVVAQYQFDFGLRPSIAYLQSKGKDIENFGDQDLVKYIDVGTTYYFNKNMSTYVDYKINLLDDNKFTRQAGIGTDNIVALGLTYQF